MSTVYTVGHSNKTSEDFINLLKKHQIEMLVDVRSVPYSKYVPHFNCNKLAQTLIDNGIKYTYMGDSLGGRPKDPTCYDNGKVDYREVAQRDFFKQGIQDLIGIANEYKTTICCSEEDPNHCHRKHLISKTLLKLSVIVSHIYGDGTLEIESAEMIKKNGRVQYKLF